MINQILITGTDTGVGKTTLATMLLLHLRSLGHHALAIKPFCSGGEQDLQLLAQGQENELTTNEICPWYFDQPVAPYVMSLRRKHLPSIKLVLGHIQRISRRCEILIIEGAGGIFVPLGRTYYVVDIIEQLKCPVVTVARNKLGVINHTLLTVRALGFLRPPGHVVVLSQATERTLATQTNFQVLTRLLRPTHVIPLPNLGLNAEKFGVLEGSAKKLKKTLAQIFGECIFSSAFERNRPK